MAQRPSEAPSAAAERPVPWAAHGSLSLVRFRRPSGREIEALLGSGELRLSYPEAGATARLDLPAIRESLEGRYDLDRHEFVLGRGRALFDRAGSALMAWRHFEIPWLDFRGPDRVEADQIVATLLRVAGLWFVNPCRVVYRHLLPEQGRVAYAYGTLSGHAESGEERFSLSLDPVTQDVLYEITAFSRPAIALSKLGYPFARRIQKRFAMSSAHALAQASA